MSPSIDSGGSVSILLNNYVLIGYQIHSDHHDASSENGSYSEALLWYGIEHASKNDECSK
jgi:hypothetical protein